MPDRSRPLPDDGGAPLGEAPRISVIMPNYNGARLISRSIDSVLGQTYGDLELLVVDDGSRDDSVAVVESCTDTRVKLLRQDHQGVCAARNLGIKQARGRYIAFLDSDDTWAPHCLERLHDALTRMPHAALAYCGWQNVGLEGGRGDPFIPPDYEIPDKLELWLRNCRWPIHAALTRTEALRAAGGFDPAFPTSEDFLLWLKIVTMYPIVRVPEVLAYYFHHGGPRATTNKLRMAMNHLGAQLHFLSGRPDVLATLGRAKVRDSTFGELLARGYACYWKGELECARPIFRRAMKAGYGKSTDWVRMLPSLLPLGMHRWLLRHRLPIPPAATNDHAESRPDARETGR